MGKDRNLDFLIGILAGEAATADSARRAVGLSIESGRADDAEDRAIADVADVEGSVRSHGSSVRNTRNRASSLGIGQLAAAAKRVPASLRSNQAVDLNQVDHALAVIAIRVEDHARNACAHSAIVC